MVEISMERIQQLSTSFIIYIRAVVKRSYLAGVAVFLTFLSFASAWLSAPIQRELDGWFSWSRCTAAACFFVATFLAWNEEYLVSQEASAAMAIKTGIDELGVSQLSGRINGLQLDSRQEDSDWKYLYVLLTISNDGAPSAVKSWKISFSLPTGRRHTVADEEFSRQPVGLHGSCGQSRTETFRYTFGRKVYRLAAATLSKGRARWTIGCDRVLLVRFPSRVLGCR